jgi:hypothetical protein
MISAEGARAGRNGRISAAGIQAIQVRFARRKHNGHYRDRRRAASLEIACDPVPWVTRSRLGENGPSDIGLMKFVSLIPGSP